MGCESVFTLLLQNLNPVTRFEFQVATRSQFPIAAKRRRSLCVQTVGQQQQHTTDSWLDIAESNGKTAGAPVKVRQRENALDSRKTAIRIDNYLLVNFRKEIESIIESPEFSKILAKLVANALTNLSLIGNKGKDFCKIITLK